MKPASLLAGLLLAGMVASSLPSALDCLSSNDSSASAFWDLLPVVQTYLSIGACYFAAFLILSVYTLPPVGIVAKLEFIPAVAGLAIFFCTICSTVIAAPIPLVLPLSAVAVIAGMLVTRWAKVNEGAPLRNRVLITAGIILALLPLAFLTLNWAAHYRLRELAETQPWWFGMAFGAVTFLGFFPLVRLSHRRKVGLGLAAIAAITMAAAFNAYAVPSGTKRGSLQAIGQELDPKRIILITIDTLRADSLSTYNSAAAATEQIDALGADGVVFENAFASASWTVPSMVSLLTGTSPDVHGVSLPIGDAPLPTIADYLSDAGYRTAAINGNFLLSSSLSAPRSSSPAHFDIYRAFDSWRVFEELRIGGGPGIRTLSWFNPELFQAGGTTQGIVQQSIQWIDRNAQEPFFLWMHIYDPHWPYAPPESFLPKDSEPGTTVGSMFTDVSGVRFGAEQVTAADRKRIRRLYEAETSYVDSEVGRLLSSLRERDMYDDTLIVLTSDHGEEFWEHDRFGHSHTLYSEILRVPLIVKLPGAGHRGRVESFVSTQAVLPTVLELAGVSEQPDLGWMPSLAPLCLGGTDSYSVPLFASGVRLYENQEAVLFDKSKYILKSDSGTESLYDIAADPGETRSLVGHQQEVLQHARDLLQAHRHESQGIRSRLGLADDAQASLSPETLQRLKSLGYL